MPTLQDIQNYFAIISYIVMILGIPVAVWKVFDNSTRKQAEGIQKRKEEDITLAGELKLLRTEMNLKMENFHNVLQTIKLNDLHSMYEKMRDYDEQQGKLEKALITLTTIINERIPGKGLKES